MDSIRVCLLTDLFSDPDSEETAGTLFDLGVPMDKIGTAFSIISFSLSVKTMIQINIFLCCFCMVTKILGNGVGVLWLRGELYGKKVIGGTMGRRRIGGDP